MKNFGLIILAAILLVAVEGRAQDEITLANPYAAIVSRNIFGLVPPAHAVPPVEAPALPKITPTGTMTVFGRWQVLFTVTSLAEAVLTTKTEFFVLGEGESESGIGVIEFHPTAGTILFNNHGTFQELPLEIRSK